MRCNGVQRVVVLLSVMMYNALCGVTMSGGEYVV